MISAFTSIWNNLATFLTSLFPSIEGLFYNAETSTLTFVGTMAVIMAGIALILLVFNLIRSFFIMRG